jgi:AraC-like DNA-binding protein
MSEEPDRAAEPRDAIHEEAMPAVEFSTRTLEEGARSDVWRWLIAPLFDARPAASRGEPLEGELSARSLGASLICRWSFGAQIHARDRRLVMSSGLDQYVVQLFVAGAAHAECSGSPVEVKTGDILIVDLSRTFCSTAPASVHVIAMIVPRAALHVLTGGRTLHGMVIGAANPFGRLLRELLAGLYRHGPFAQAEARAAEEAALALIAAAVSRNPDPAFASASTFSGVLRQRILHYIDERPGDPELNLAHLMARFSVSRAHIYRIFADDGGVAAMIRDRRLDAAFRDLVEDGARPIRSITEIAHEYSFSNSSYFVRAFRARFTCSPSEARHSGIALRMDNTTRAILTHFSRIAASGTA